MSVSTGVLVYLHSHILCRKQLIDMISTESVCLSGERLVHHLQWIKLQMSYVRQSAESS